MMASSMTSTSQVTTNTSMPEDPSIERADSRACRDEGSTDSGYVSAANTLDHSTSTGLTSLGEELTLPSRLLRKPTKLIIFNSEDIPQATLDRFDDLLLLFREPLYDIVFKGRNRCSGTAVKCMMLGEGVFTAKPWIVVLCDSSISKQVKTFFEQIWVKEECHPKDPDLPYLDYIIHKRPPRAMSGSAVATRGSPIHNFHEGFEECRTLCGRLLRVGSSEEYSIVTLEGVIKLELDSGIQLLGLTAAHVLPYEEKHCDSGEVLEDDNDKADSEELYELDLKASGLAGYSDSAISTSFDQFQFSFGSWETVGNIYAKSAKVESDWALIELNSTLFRPNLILETYSSSQAPFELTKAAISTRRKYSDPVVVLSSMSGQLGGHILQSRSYYLPSRGTMFTMTYSLELSGGMGETLSMIAYYLTDVSRVLCPGDCGSWVVDAFSHEVLGHAVAADVFKQVYFIPLQATFQDIEQQLMARSVTLPNNSKISMHLPMSKSLKHQDKSFESLLRNPSHQKPEGPQDLDNTSLKQGTYAIKFMVRLEGLEKGTKELDTLIDLSCRGNYICKHQLSRMQGVKIFRYPRLKVIKSFFGKEPEEPVTHSVRVKLCNKQLNLSANVELAINETKHTICKHDFILGSDFVMDNGGSKLLLALDPGGDHDDVLKGTGSKLSQNPGTKNERIKLHGLVNIGKSQTALEYTKSSSSSHN